MENDKDKDDWDLNNPPVFYYSRERRLERVSPELRAFNEEGIERRRFLNRIFVTKKNSVFFIAILLLCVMVGMIFRLTGTDKNIGLGRNNLTVVITREDGVAIMEIVKNLPKKGEAYLGAVDIAVSPVMPKSKEGEVMELPPVFSHRIIFTPAVSESYIISLPFEENEVFVVFRTANDQKSQKLRVEKAK